MKSSPKKGNAPGGRSPEALIEANHLAEESNMSNSKALTIGTTSVREVDGLYSLNDLHKAAGNEKRHQPADFLKIDQTKALIAEIGNSEESRSLITKEGRGGGTFACKELVIAYAAWISAAFHLKVIRVFLSVAAPQPEIVQATLDYDRISPAQAQDLKQIVQAIVDAGIQKYAETWARLQRKFKVHSYLALHPDQYEAARAYLIAKLPNGCAPEVDEDFKQGTLRPFDGVAMRAARQVAMGFMTSTYQAAKAGLDAPPMANLPSEVLTGVLANALTQQRFLAFFNAECCLQLKPMSDGAVVIDFENADLDTIAQAVPMARLAALMEALSRRTQTHLDAFGSYLTRAGGVQLM